VVPEKIPSFEFKEASHKMGVITIDGSLLCLMEFRLGEEKRAELLEGGNLPRDFTRCAPAVMLSLCRRVNVKTWWTKPKSRSFSIS
jgi:hypothetical protein